MDGGEEQDSTVKPKTASRPSHLPKWLLVTAGAIAVTLIVISFKTCKENPDADKDGLPDKWEQQIIVADPDDEIERLAEVMPDDDFDNDRLSNLEEFLKGEDPTVARLDKDNDRMSDLFEKKIFEADEEDEIKSIDDVLPGDDFDKDGVSNIQEEIDGTDPTSGDPHPLAGRKMILSAPPSDWRYAYLSYDGGTGAKGYPLATVEHDDRCAWKLEGKSGHADVYYILCDHPGKWRGARLSYDSNNGRFQWVTVETGDTSLWKITRAEDFDSGYRITCFDDTKFTNWELTWDMGTGLKIEYPLATLEAPGEDRTAWLILPADGKHPRQSLKFESVTHVIVFPNKKNQDSPPDDLLEWAAETYDHIKAGGIEKILLKTELAGGLEPVGVAQGQDYKAVRKKVEALDDPVIAYLPGYLKTGAYDLDLEAALKLEIGKLPPFPLVLPVQSGATVEVKGIRYLEFEDRGFKHDATLEEIKNFQTRLDVSPKADGRVFHGEYYTYVFVNLSAGK